MDMKTKDQDASSSFESRRRFMKLSAAAGGGLLFGFSLFGCEKKDEPSRDKPPPERAVGAATSANSDKAPGLARDAFIRIDRDGQVTFICPRVEMGQGTFTAIPMLLAEELGVDPDKVKLEQAPANNALYSEPLLGGQVTGGSTSVRGAWKPMREAGAAVRSVLVTVAAKQWNVDPGSVKVIDGRIIHPDGKKSLGFGDVADEAAKLPMPAKVELKPASGFTLIGKPHHRLDSSIKCNGQALFGLDTRLPNMGIAAVAISPVVGGKLASADEQKAMAVKGVRQVVKLDNAVAVIGDHFWAAHQGLAAAAPTWNDGPNANATTASIVADMMKASQQTGAVAANKGDALKRLDDKNGRRIDAVYEDPFLAHATMEPMNCTVDLKPDGCDIYCGTQVPALAQAAAAQVTGLPQEKVRVHNYYLGGGFGRRLEVDYVVQAVQIAKAAGKGPVKLVWTRENDIQHDMYRPYYVDHISARLDDKNMPVAWFHRITGSSVMARFAPSNVKNGVDPDAVEAAADIQYAIPDFRVEYVRSEPPIPTAFWRGVGPTHNIWVVESFIDELAAAGKHDPVDFRRALLKDAPRKLGVLNLAAEKAGWGKPVAKVAGRRMGRGVSCQFAFGSYLAQVCDVSVGPDGDVKVHRVVCAVDCGQTVNPDTITAQMEGGIIFGLTAALWGEITLDKGRVQQSNFNDYRVMRMSEAPQIEVYIVTSKDDPGGIGEPGTSGSMPALTNAVFAATGKRIRKLPIGDQLKKA